MFRIILNNINLDVSDVNIRWESVNNLFEDNAFQNDFSFPTTLPYTDTNLKALGFINKPAVIKEAISFPIIFCIANNSTSAKLIVNGSNRKGFNVNIAAGIKGLNSSDTLLKDLNYDVDTIDLGTNFGLTALYVAAHWPNKIALPTHYNPDFYGSANPTFQGVINRMDSTAGVYKHSSLGDYNEYCIVPFLYIFYILKTIADQEGLTLDGTFWEDEEASTALLYNNYALDKPIDEGVIVLNPSVQLMNFTAINVEDVIEHSNAVAGAKDDANNWSNASDRYDVPNTGDYGIKLEYEIEVISFGPNLECPIIVALYYFDGSSDNLLTFLTHTDNPGDIIKDTLLAIQTGATSSGGYFYAKVLTDQPLDSSKNVGTYKILNSKLTITRFDITEANQMTPIVTIANHLPNITVEEFFRLIKNFGKLKIDVNWNKRTISLDYGDDILNSEPEVDLTHFADPYPEQLLEGRVSGFTLRYDFGNDALADGNFVALDQTKIVGEYNTIEDLPIASIVGDLAIVLNENKVYRTEIVSAAPAWVAYTDYYYPVEVGDKKVERTIELAPMLMTRTAENESASNANHRKCLMPTIRETGSSIMFGLGINDPSLRIVFMRGLNQDFTVGGYYIYASSTNIDINGNQVGNYSLRLTGTNNWYDKKLKSFFLAIDNSEIYEYLIHMPIKYLSFKGKVQIKNVNYIVKNISTVISKTIKQSVVKLLKL